MHNEAGSEIVYGHEVLLTLTDKDALWAKKSREELSQEYRDRIVQSMYQLQEDFSFWALLKRIIKTLIVVVGQFFLIRLTNYLFKRLRNFVLKRAEKRAKPLKIKDYELLSPEQVGKALWYVVNIVRWIVIILQLIVTVPFVFAIFPQTKDLAYTIFGYIWTPIKSILLGIVNYIPNLITIIIIWYAIRKLIQIVRYLAREVATGDLKINGFYPDWAAPTYQIIRFLLYAFMLAMIYPYLPGSDSGVFQGISVLVGLMVSFGSSAVIGNIIAGLVITYMRPFRKGDCVLLNDRLGVVIEKTPLVTRIQTPKNEIITVPNSSVMNSHTVNYTLSAVDLGLIVHAEVTLGYDVPRQQVEDLLIRAARLTPNVIEMPEPFVFVNAHHDFYVEYQINAYICDALKLGSIYSNLRGNIIDVFREADIDLSSPHFYSQVGTSSYFDQQTKEEYAHHVREYQDGKRKEMNRKTNDTNPEESHSISGNAAPLEDGAAKS